MPKKLKSGFVTIVGRPNVGKSTLLNQLLGAKVSIVTDKAQTTRNNIRGILTKEDEYQIIFLDTPGIHTAKNEVDRYMNSTAFKGMKDTDLILFLAPVDEKIGKNDHYIVEQLSKKEGIKKFLILTKADTVSKEKLIQKVEEWKSFTNFDETILISAVKNINIDKLLELIIDYLPNNVFYYDKNQITDQPNRFYIQEIIREKILLKTGQEVPHSVAIMIDELEETETEMKIMATIFVERDSQKGIIIGAQGKKLKDIKYLARKELERTFDKKISLDIYVKVKRDWRKSPSLVKKLGYDKNKY